MTTHDIKRLSLVQTVLLRPRMYTVGGSLPELLAFFNGCLIPSRELATRDDGSVRLLVDWMSEECGFDDALINIRRAHEMLLDRFGTEQDVIFALKEHCLDDELRRPQ